MKSVEETAVVHPARPARLSVTWTGAKPGAANAACHRRAEIDAGRHGEREHTEDDGRMSAAARVGASRRAVAAGRGRAHGVGEDEIAAFWVIDGDRIGNGGGPADGKVAGPGQVRAGKRDRADGGSGIVVVAGVVEHAVRESLKVAPVYGSGRCRT